MVFLFCHFLSLSFSPKFHLSFGLSIFRSFSALFLFLPKTTMQLFHLPVCPTSSALRLKTRFAMRWPFYSPKTSTKVFSKASPSRTRTAPPAMRWTLTRLRYIWLNMCHFYFIFASDFCFICTAHFNPATVYSPKYVILFFICGWFFVLLVPRLLQCRGLSPSHGTFA